MGRGGPNLRCVYAALPCNAKRKTMQYEYTDAPIYTQTHTHTHANANRQPPTAPNHHHHRFVHPWIHHRPRTRSTPLPSPPPNACVYAQDFFRLCITFNPFLRRRRILRAQLRASTHHLPLHPHLHFLLLVLVPLRRSRFSSGLMPNHPD